MIDVKLSIHPVAAQLVNEYAEEHRISDPQKIANISEKMRQSANGILNTVKKKGLKNSLSELGDVHLNSKYNDLLKKIVRAVWGLEIQPHSTITFYTPATKKPKGPDVKKSKSHSIFIVSRPDPNKCKFINPKSDSFESTFKKDFSLLQEFRKDNRFTDVTLHCETTEIKVHKLVLAARSKFFLSAFTNGMKESSEDFFSIDLEGMGIDLKHFKEFVDFLYIDEVLLKERPIADIRELLILARFYQVDSLLKACIHELANQFNDENAHEIYDIGSKYDIEELKNMVLYREYDPSRELRDC